MHAGDTYIYVTGFWKTYHLLTNEIIRISDFTLNSVALSHMSTKFISAIILVIECILSIYSVLFTYSDNSS